MKKTRTQELRSTLYLLREGILRYLRIQLTHLGKVTRSSVLEFKLPVKTSSEYFISISGEYITTRNLLNKSTYEVALDAISNEDLLTILDAIEKGNYVK